MTSLQFGHSRQRLNVQVSVDAARELVVPRFPLLEGVEGELLVRDLAAVRGADDLVDVGGGRVAAVQVRVERGVVRLLVEDGDVLVAAAGEVEGGAEAEDARADDVDGRVFAGGNAGHVSVGTSWPGW